MQLEPVFLGACRVLRMHKDSINACLSCQHSSDTRLQPRCAHASPPPCHVIKAFDTAVTHQAFWWVSAAVAGCARERRHVGVAGVARKHLAPGVGTLAAGALDVGCAGLVHCLLGLRVTARASECYEPSRTSG